MNFHLSIVRLLAFAALLLLAVPFATAQPPRGPAVEDVLEAMKPYEGTSVTENKVDNTTMIGKVMCGYQGWFTTDGNDGARQRWIHYAIQGKFEPGYSAVEMWPDTSEMADDEKFATPFKHEDGSTAYVFSSLVYKTVRRHFQWMQDSGIHGVFLQRFSTSIRNPEQYRIRNLLVSHARQAANESGRVWALMYDLSGLPENGTKSMIIEDFKRLSDRMKIGKDPNDKAYMQHRGKPLIAVWGIGFNDNRRYTLAECLELITFLKDDPEYGGFSVMIGVPTYWREMGSDSLKDPILHEIIKKADIVSPWAVGRFANPKAVADYTANIAKKDLEWCEKEGVDYLPVVYPGFSWQNLMKGRGQTSPLDQIPRLKGEFLETQYIGHIAYGAKMIYQAMFDEIDEGTAIFKVSNNPPVGESRFLGYEGLPSDFYLKMVGKYAQELQEKYPKK